MLGEAAALEMSLGGRAKEWLPWSNAGSAVSEVGTEEDAEVRMREVVEALTAEELRAEEAGAEKMLERIREGERKGKGWRKVVGYCVGRASRALLRRDDDPCLAPWANAAMAAAGGGFEALREMSDFSVDAIRFHYRWRAVARVAERMGFEDDLSEEIAGFCEGGILGGGREEERALVRQARLLAGKTVPESLVAEVRERIASGAKAEAEEKIGEIERRWPSLPFVAHHLRRDLRGIRKAPKRKASGEYVVVDLRDGKAEQTDEAVPVGEDIYKTSKLALKRIPAGEFMMGDHSGAGSQGIAHYEGKECERPVHRVRLTRDCWLGVYPVTQGQWAELMGYWPSRFTAEPAKRPVEQVSWLEAQVFLARLGEETGLAFNLPSEAQWEYACRAGTETDYWWGNEPDEACMWWAKNSGQQTREVGRKRAGPRGLYDMSGNVWEWCADWYGEDYYKESPVEDPQGPMHGRYRVLRGGSWGADPVSCRSACRNGGTPDGRGDSSGFRPLLDSLPYIL